MANLSFVDGFFFFFKKNSIALMGCFVIVGVFLFPLKGSRFGFLFGDLVSYFRNLSFSWAVLMKL